MKEIKLSELKKMSAEEILNSACMEVTADGEVIGYFIVHPEWEMKQKIISLSSLIDASRGR